MTEPSTVSSIECLNERTPQADYAVCWFTVLTIICSMAALTARMIDGTPLRSANDRSRWCTVWSLVERNTYQIDEIRQKSGWDSIDIVKHNDHFYSTKPPLMPRMVAELYRIVKWSTGWTLTDNTGPTTWLILFLFNILPAGISLWLFCGIIRRYCDDLFGQCFLISAACWGMLYLPFLTVLNNHSVAITSIIFALALSISIVVEDKQQPWRFALCGLFAMFGCCNELPAAAFGIAFFVLLLKKNPQRTLLFFSTCAMLPLLAFFLTNYYATGGWKPFYMYYGTEKYLFVHEGVPSYWLDPKGVDKARDSFATYLLHCTIGHHGILSLTPIMFLTILGWIIACFQKVALRAFSLLGLGLTVLVMAFYLSKTENYNFGGVSVALRWTLWLTPFWVLSMIAAMNKFGRSKSVRTVSLLLLSISVFSAWYPAASPWTQPWLYRWMESAKWIDYSEPRPQFDRKHSTWIGEIPEGDLKANAWVTFGSYNTNNPAESFTLRDGGPHEVGLRKFIVESTKSVGAVDSETFIIDRSAFLKGASPAAFVLSKSSGQVSAADLQFFQGMPTFRPYASSRIRYVKTSLRKDAFKCHVGYSYVNVKDKGGLELQYIRDVWYCDEVPFGVLQWQDRVIDAKSKTELSTKLWLATGFGGEVAKD